MVFSLVIVCVSVPVACGMKWLNLKRVGKERKEMGVAELERENEATVDEKGPWVLGADTLSRERKEMGVAEVESPEEVPVDEEGPSVSSAET